jgi:hypothetical protein
VPFEEDCDLRGRSITSPPEQPFASAAPLETEAAIRTHELEPGPLQSNDTLAGEILKGAQAIAAFLGEQDNLRNVYHWLETGQISAFKLAGAWVSTKRRLRDQFHKTQHVPKAKEGNGEAEPELVPPPTPRPGQIERRAIQRRRRT